MITIKETINKINQLEINIARTAHRERELKRRNPEYLSAERMHIYQLCELEYYKSRLTKTMNYNLSKNFRN